MILRVDAKEINYSRHEANRYMGYGKVSPDANVAPVIEACEKDLYAGIRPIATVERFPLTHNEDGSIEMAGMHVLPGNLTKNLTGCKEVFLLAATIGDAPDRLVRIASIKKEMAKTVILQATAAAMVEEWVNMVNRKCKEMAAEEGLFIRPRFSPGYGDFPLEFQKDFARVLNMASSVGINLGDSLLMTPSKSVTAVIGISEIDKNCHIGGCEECNMHETCQFSRA